MKKKLRLVIWPIIYLVLIINVCISFALVFRSYYFRSIFVSGSSMEPTLHGQVGQRVDYGIIDDHDSAISRIKRFQIITTYYPFSGSSDYIGEYVPGGNNVINENEASYKIKRVYALPGESIRFTVDNEMLVEAQKKKAAGDAWGAQAQDFASRALKVEIRKVGSEEFVEQKLKFKRRIDIAKIPDYDGYQYDLEKDQYWVMGDNYSASSDCYSKREPIYKDNIVGVLVAIEGTCVIDAHIDPDSTVDGTKISYQCKQRKRHFPKYY